MDVIINADADCLPPGSTQLVTQYNYLLNLMIAMGFHEENPPVADFLRQIHKLEGEWLVVEPVYWEASHNDAMIAAAGQQLHLTDDESRLLFRDIAAFLAEDGLSLHYHNAGTWLVKVDGKPKISSKSTSLMLHQSMMPVIKGMDDTMYWQRLITELQMYLGSHPGAQRDAGLTSVNGLWFYGSGDFKFDSSKTIVTDDEQLLAAFPSNMKRLSCDAPRLNHSIVVINDYQSINMDNLLSAIGNQPVRWFWNNIAYSSPRKSWWARLRGRLNAGQTKRTI